MTHESERPSAATDQLAITTTTRELVLAHIEEAWEGLTFSRPQTHGISVGVPHPFVSPSAEIAFAGQQFYWDTYFTIIGLVECGRMELAKGMVENLVALLREYGIIPLRNRIYNLGTSQPPLLTRMAKEVHQTTGDDAWLADVMEAARTEYDGYWMDDTRPEKHLVFQGLSRYCDHYVTHPTAEHESGWDMTSRFRDRCMDVLPVDLNSMLYAYETDLSEHYAKTERTEEAEEFRRRADERAKTMHDLMWSEKEGFFFDYNYQFRLQSDFFSLAGLYPLWAGLATEEQARRVREHLKVFEQDGGLANTQPHGLSAEFRQWDYPNGWPNQQWIAFSGLRRYGLTEDAVRIAQKWLALCEDVFSETGELWEKYDVVNRQRGVAARYPTQPGFGWTNAVYVRLVKELSRD